MTNSATDSSSFGACLGAGYAFIFTYICSLFFICDILGILCMFPCSLSHHFPSDDVMIVPVLLCDVVHDTQAYQAGPSKTKHIRTTSGASSNSQP